MTAFSLRGSTALVALSVSLTFGAPFIALAQETPEIAAPVIAPPAAPAAETPWQPVTRLGLRFELPPDAAIPAPDAASREFAVSTIGADGIGARLGMRMLDTAERESMPAPGSPEMAAFLSDLAGLPLTETGVVMELGGRRMIAYGGSGPIPASGGAMLEARMLYLIAEEPDADGNALMVAVFSAGLGAGVAADLEAHFVGSLAPADETPETPTEDDASAAPDSEAAEEPAAMAAAEPATEAPGTEAVAPEAPSPDPLTLAEALPLPARLTPEGWQRLSAFDLSVAGPGDAELRDRRSSRHPEVSLRLRDRAAGTELEIGMATLPAQEITEMGAVPGTPGFTAMLTGRSGLDYAESPRRILVGDRGMMIYVGLGTNENGSFRGAYVLSVFLVTEEPDANGNWIVIGAAARGYEPDVAQDLVSQAVRSVAPDLAEEPAAEQPAVTEPPLVADTPAAEAEGAQGFAAIAAALPEPSGTLPDGWQRVEALGVSMGVPPDLAVELDAEGRGLNIGGRDEAARTEIEMGGILAGPQVSARFNGLPGTPGFVETLSGWAEVEVQDSGRDMIVAGQPMRLYIASGAIEETPQLGGTLTGFYLVTLEASAEGDYLVLGGAFRGYPEAEAVALISGIVGSLPAAAEPAASVAPEAPTTEATILPGAASALLPPEMVVAGEERNARSADLFFSDAGPDGQRHSRITAGFLQGRDVNGQLRLMLHNVDALVETEIAGLPVWVIHGIATRSLEDQRVEASVGVPAQIVVPRLCENGNPPYLVGVLAAPGQEARIDALMATLQLRAPEGATPCPDSVMDEVRGIIARTAGGEAATASPPAPVTLQAAPVVPPGWTRHVQFGLTFAAPDGMELRRERTEPDAMEYWLQGRDASGQVANEISIRVFTPTALDRMPVATPDQPGFADMLSGFSEVPVAPTDERLILGDVTLRAFRGEGTYSEGDGSTTGRVLYLIAEAPSANGLSPWLVLHSANQSPEAHAAFEAAFLSSLGGSPEIPPQQPPAPQVPPVALEPVEPTRPPTVPPVASTASPEATAWQAARADGTSEAILAYLAAYPRGLHSGDARALLRERGVVPPDERRPEPPRVDPEAMDWQRALTENRMEAFWTYLKMWPQGLHADEARANLDRLRPPPPPPPARYPQPGK